MPHTTLTLTGWLGTDVTLNHAGGHAVATFRVGSTPRRFRDGVVVSGNTTWFQVKAWRHVAEHAARSLRRGDPVIVQGRLTVELWEREDGVAVSKHVVVAHALGHDLAHGTTQFTRVARESAARGDEQEAPSADEGVGDLVPTPGGEMDDAVRLPEVASTGSEAA